MNALDASLSLHGHIRSLTGSLVLDGSSVIELKDTAKLNGSFTVSVWFNPYVLEGAQQMIVGKSRYSFNERQWGITIEPNGKLKVHLRQDGWSEITCLEPLKAGHWHLATLTVDYGKAALFLNGKLVGEVKLKKG